MKFNKRKFWAVFFIIVQLFLIFGVIKNYWAERKVTYLEKEVFKKGDLSDPAIGELLKKLQRWSTRDPRVWELSARYALEKMVQSEKFSESRQWAQEAVRCSTHAVRWAPTVKKYQNLRARSLQWEKVFTPAEE